MNECLAQNSSLISYQVTQYLNPAAPVPERPTAQEMLKDTEYLGMAEKDANSVEIKEKYSQRCSQSITENKTATSCSVF